MKRQRLTMDSVRSNRSILGALKIDLLLLSFLVIGGLLYYLDSHPIRLGSSDPPMATGVDVSGAEEGDVLLLMQSAAEADAETLDTLDFAANWANILSQEFGVFRIAEIDQFTPSLLERTALVVVPRSTSRLLTAGQVATLEQFVQGGGRLVVELPTAVWQPLLGIAADPAQFRPTRRITAFDGAVVRGELRDDVLQTPMSTIMAPVQNTIVSALDDIDVLMEIDGQPGYLRRRLGDGEVFALFFDVARAVGVIQQGMPAADWEIARPAVALPEGFTRTACLVGDPRLRRTSVPFADLLERQILATVTLNRPIPRIWTFPGRHRGALIMSHTALPSASDGRFMLDWEVEAEYDTTVFLAADELDASLGLEPRQLGLLLMSPELPTAPSRPVGLFGLAPLLRPLSLEDQVGQLRRNDEDAQILSRVSGGLWHPDYGHSFRVLAGLGVDVDTSYGPARHPTDLEAVEGYSFGTGLPFRPLDRNGRLLPLIEVPTLLQDSDSLDGDWANRLIERAGRVYNELVLVDWQLGTMTRNPRAKVVTTWRSLFDRAVERDLWITDLSSFIDFWHRRSEVRMRSEFSAAERRLSVWIEVPATDDELGETAHPSIIFEANFDERPVERITRNGEDVPFVELGRTADGTFHIYELHEGTSRIEITYQGPILIDE